MTSHKFIDVRLHVMATGERNGQRYVKTNSLPAELEPYSAQLEMKRVLEPSLQIYVQYEPFLGFVDASEGDDVLFRLDTATVKLSFAPTPDLYLGDPRVPLALAPSLVHRFYKLSDHHDDPSLFWCVGLTSDKKKQKAILLDVARLSSSSLPINQEPSRTSKDTSSLYSTTKISKLLVAIPNRANLSPRSPTLSRSSSSDDIPLSPSKSTPSKTKNIANRLKKRLHGYEEEMLDLSPRDAGSVV